MDLLCQNWPMKVSKDQHLKAERKCLSTAAAEWSVTRDQTPGTIWGYHTSMFFLKILANMYRERKTWSSRKFGESNFFFGEDGVFQMKEFRTTLIYTWTRMNRCDMLWFFLGKIWHQNFQISAFFWASDDGFRCVVHIIQESKETCAGKASTFPWMK